MLCEGIDAYEVNSTYRTCLNNHLMMMHGSLAKSFGAREEVRGSGTSIRQVMEDAADLMQTYLEDANPILAVKSDLYFGFQIRRMRELRNVQMHMAKYRPQNYGTITSVLMHMMQHIAHSPVASTGYLRDALRELRFHKVMERFGTFFLHEMDLEGAAVLQIDKEDSDKCLLVISQVKSLQKIKEMRGIEVAIVADEEPTEQFPIGNAPTWEEISLMMARWPTMLMSDWVWDEKWVTRSTASRLFVQFTIDYFLTLSTDALKVPEFPKPHDLKGAMELWTMQSLMTVLKDVSFKPSNHGLKGHALMSSQCCAMHQEEMVGKAKRRGTARGTQVKASKVIIKARLDEEHRHIPFNEARLKARKVKKARKQETKRRSGNKNNYRKPPIKKQTKVVTPSDESLENEVAKSSDENSQDVPSVRVIWRRVISEEELEEEEEEIDQLEDDYEMEEVEDELDDSDMDVDEM
ncbi:hypothetical protein PILCRDRAFT_91756 [Piloderma croceum F 1598]|uniref:Uncharacterized protein n=1 Tax=Piloderma croceum (strain F 1598) TaxID=765440 RepID=A0A0C3AQF0_PILCF|nr:hypothetical protein PILCRDRAFT_91756 [Piloderma croceum F 1598]